MADTPATSEQDLEYSDDEFEYSDEDADTGSTNSPGPQIYIQFDKQPAYEYHEIKAFPFIKALEMTSTCSLHHTGSRGKANDSYHKPSPTSKYSLSSADPVTPFRYNDLPAEIRAMVMVRLFTFCRTKQDNDAVLSVTDEPEWYGGLCQDCSEGLSTVRRFTTIHLPNDFLTLFTSTTVLEETLPIFATNTTIDKLLLQELCYLEPVE